MGRYLIGWNRQGPRWLVPALAAVAFAGPVQAEAPTWTPVDASTGRISSIEELQALVGKFPDSASVRLRLLNAYLDTGRRADAAQAAADLIERGYVFSARAGHAARPRSY